MWTIRSVLNDSSPPCVLDRDRNDVALARVRFGGHLVARSDRAGQRSSNVSGSPLERNDGLGSLTNDGAREGGWDCRGVPDLNNHVVRKKTNKGLRRNSALGT